ncbi:MAG TPA: hypothetical protein VFR24_27370 [Candidatus Angelobacter sp.]|nr:hypothetical protein [Candidatus Angelobacter sp.]
MVAPSVSEDESRKAAAVAFQFLKRVNGILAEDADNYIAVRNWLAMVVDGRLRVVGPKPVKHKRERLP